MIREENVEIDGTIFAITSDDDYLNSVNSADDGFEPHMVRLFKSLANKSKIIIDIGANIGCTALLFGGISEKVYAFEPSPTTFRFLEKNIAQSGRTNIVCYNFGLGSQAGESTLTFAPSNRSGAFVSNQTKASIGHTVESIKIKTLDEVVKSHNFEQIDLIKIDVEGFEEHVIRGGKVSLAHYLPRVVLELNHWCLNAFQRTSVPDFFDFLRSMFPILLAVDGSHYLDIHNESDSYSVMYHHITQMRYQNIVAAFDYGQINEFLEHYSHGE